MKLFYINLIVKNNELTKIDIFSQNYVNTLKLKHDSHREVSDMYIGPYTYVVYGIVKADNAKEALDVGLKYIEENKLI